VAKCKIQKSCHFAGHAGGELQRTKANNLREREKQRSWNWNGHYHP
jgi:hypothetical protein